MASACVGRSSLDERLFKCNVCQAKFWLKTKLIKHYETHTEAPSICNVCGVPFQNSNELEEHYLSHQLIKPFSCLICGSSYLTECELQKHTAVMHPELKQINKFSRSVKSSSVLVNSKETNNSVLSRPSSSNKTSIISKTFNIQTTPIKKDEMKTLNERPCRKNFPEFSPSQSVTVTKSILKTKKTPFEKRKPVVWMEPVVSDQFLIGNSPELKLTSPHPADSSVLEKIRTALIDNSTVMLPVERKLTFTSNGDASSDKVQKLAAKKIPTKQTKFMQNVMGQVSAQQGKTLLQTRNALLKGRIESMSSSSKGPIKIINLISKPDKAISSIEVPSTSTGKLPFSQDKKIMGLQNSASQLLTVKTDTISPVKSVPTSNVTSNMSVVPHAVVMKDVTTPVEFSHKVLGQTDTLQIIKLPLVKVKLQQSESLTNKPLPTKSDKTPTKSSPVKLEKMHSVPLNTYSKAEKNVSLQAKTKHIQGVIDQNRHTVSDDLDQNITFNIAGTEQYESSIDQSVISNSGKRTLGKRRKSKQTISNPKKKLVQTNKSSLSKNSNQGPVKERDCVKNAVATKDDFSTVESGRQSKLIAVARRTSKRVTKTGIASPTEILKLNKANDVLNIDAISPSKNFNQGATKVIGISSTTKPVSQSKPVATRASDKGTITGIASSPKELVLNKDTSLEGSQNNNLDQLVTKVIGLSCGLMKTSIADKLEPFANETNEVVRAPIINKRTSRNQTKNTQSLCVSKNKSFQLSRKSQIAKSSQISRLISLNILLPHLKLERLSDHLYELCLIKGYVTLLDIKKSEVFNATSKKMLKAKVRLEGLARALSGKSAENIATSLVGAKNLNSNQDDKDLQSAILLHDACTNDDENLKEKTVNVSKFQGKKFRGRNQVEVSTLRVGSVNPECIEKSAEVSIENYKDLQSVASVKNAASNIPSTAPKPKKARLQTLKPDIINSGRKVRKRSTTVLKRKPTCNPRSKKVNIKKTKHEVKKSVFKSNNISIPELTVKKECVTGEMKTYSQMGKLNKSTATSLTTQVQNSSSNSVRVLKVPAEMMKKFQETVLKSSPTTPVPEQIKINITPKVLNKFQNVVQKKEIGTDSSVGIIPVEKTCLTPRISRVKLKSKKSNIEEQINNQEKNVPLEEVKKKESSQKAQMKYDGKQRLMEVRLNKKNPRISRVKLDSKKRDVEEQIKDRKKVPEEEVESKKEEISQKVQLENEENQRLEEINLNEKKLLDIIEKHKKQLSHIEGDLQKVRKLTPVAGMQLLEKVSKIKNKKCSKVIKELLLKLDVGKTDKNEKHTIYGNDLSSESIINKEKALQGFLNLTLPKKKQNGKAQSQGKKFTASNKCKASKTIPKLSSSKVASFQPKVDSLGFSTTRCLPKNVISFSRYDSRPKRVANDPFTDLSIITNEKYTIECPCNRPNCDGLHPESLLLSC